MTQKIITGKRNVVPRATVHLFGKKKPHLCNGRHRSDEGMARTCSDRACRQMDPADTLSDIGIAHFWRLRTFLGNASSVKGATADVGNKLGGEQFEYVDLKEGEPLTEME